MARMAKGKPAPNGPATAIVLLLQQQICVERCQTFLEAAGHVYQLLRIDTEQSIEAIVTASLKAVEGNSGECVIVPDTIFDDKMVVELVAAFSDAALEGRKFQVIAVAGSSDSRIGSALLAAGAAHILTSPVNEAALIRSIAEAQSGRDPAASIRSYLKTNKSAVGRMMSSTFEIRTLQEAERLATMLANQFPEPERVATGIWELLANAIEHGNLGISYEEKTQLILDGKLPEEIERRLDLPKYCLRVATVAFRRQRDKLALVVQDQGDGFDFDRFMTDELSADGPNGRGIFIANKLSFDRIEYRDGGREVEATILV